MMGTFLMIGLGIFAVLIVLRLLGALFGRSRGAGYPNQMGMGGPRPGMGPGYRRGRLRRWRWRRRILLRTARRPRWRHGRQLAV